MIGSVNQIDAPQPRIGTGNVFEISTLSEKCFSLSYSVNTLQAISPSSRQHVGEPDLESDGGRVIFVCLCCLIS